MKLKLATIALLFIITGAYSQSKNSFTVFYAPTGNVVDIHGAKGDFGYNAETGTLFGFDYTCVISRRLLLETGLQYSNSNVQLNYIVPGIGSINKNGQVKLITLPIYAKRNFSRYFFIYGGLLFEHETNYTSDPIVNDQSGLGLELGFGGRLNVGKVQILITPFFRVHDLIQKSSGSNNNLVEDGVKFGVGYDF